MRADQYLLANGFVASRQKAKELIEAGAVHVDGTPLKKASQSIAQGAAIIIDSPLTNWVSRGALKLLGGLDAFPAITPQDKICLDIGASTGGFTEVCLRHGAAHIYAIDVGHGQLAPSLAKHPRITSVEKCNARYLDNSHVPEPFQLIVCDVSFISLKLALPAAMTLAPQGCEAMCLVKPQFEVGRSGLDKGGIVKDDSLRQQVLDDMVTWFKAQGWDVLGTADSPITGPDGNHEFLLAARKL